MRDHDIILLIMYKIEAFCIRDFNRNPADFADFWPLNISKEFYLTYVFNLIH